jgi:hypothetical protein
MGRIERCDVIVCSPGRNFVTLTITTSDGIVGWGERHSERTRVVRRGLPLGTRGTALIGHDASCSTKRPRSGSPTPAKYHPVARLADGTLHDV